MLRTNLDTRPEACHTQSLIAESVSTLVYPHSRIEGACRDVPIRAGFSFIHLTPASLPLANPI